MTTTTPTADLARLAAEQAAWVMNERAALEAEHIAARAAARVRANRDRAVRMLAALRAELASLEDLCTAGVCKTCGDADPYGMRGRVEELRAKVAECAWHVANHNAAVLAAEDAHEDAVDAHRRIASDLMRVTIQRERAEREAAQVAAGSPT